ncbi:MAG: hypothetical protein ACI97A_001475 [Planctomycetota bacterium]|jgi:hypothetical protein
MPKKLKFLFKATIAASFLYGLFVLFFLQEVGIFGDSFLKACEEKGVHLPLTDPKILVDVSDATLTISEGDTVVRRYDISTGTNRVVGSLKKEMNSTPLGTYKVVRKAVRESVLFTGSRFLEINFPCTDDVELAWEQGLIDGPEYERYHAAKDSNQELPQDLKFSRTLGIQGNYFSIMGQRSTNGGVALSNGDLNDVFDHIPVGTPVTIRR